MSDTGANSSSQLPGEPAGSSAGGDLAVVHGRFDAFISYRRLAEDVAFVDRLQAALAGRGKNVWVDRAEIEPAADWSARITRGIAAAKAFIFVITPESVVSGQCLRELEMATQRHKFIVPVVLRDVDPDQRLPEGLTRPNWIFFSPGHDEWRALDEVMLALEEDLDWRDAHTRLDVRAREWADSQRDRSFVLRGSDLRSAEEWLGQGGRHEKTPPTALQTEYLLASRKAAVRTQRSWRAALSAGLVVALALAAVAFVQRGQARTEARVAQGRALAAEATADLTSNPEQSLSLALSSMKLGPSGPAEQALRLALAQDRLRMVISSGTGSATLTAWNANHGQLAVTAPHDSVALWNTATGRLSQILHTNHAVNQLLYDPRGSRLAAVSSAGYVSMWNISATGAASPLSTSALNATIQALAPPPSPDSLGLLMQGTWAANSSDDFDIFSGSLPYVFAFDPGTAAIAPLFPVSAQGIWNIVPSPDGSRLFVSNLDGGYIMNRTTGRHVGLSAPPGSPPGPACWFPDGSALVTSTAVEIGGPEQIYRAANGALFTQMKTPAAPTTAVTCSAGTADEWVAAGDESGNVVLRLASGATVPLYGHNSAISAIASSPDGRYLATASSDGTARIWNAGTGQVVTVLDGNGAPLTNVQFGSTAGLVLTVDSRGFVRIWDTEVGDPAVTLQRPTQGQAVVLGFTSDGQHVTGASLMSSTGPAAQVTSASALTWSAQTGRLIRQVPLPGIAGSAEPCSKTLQGAGSMGAIGMLTGSDCAIPPPPEMTMAVPVIRPGTDNPDQAAIELLALTTSPDGRYVAYARFDSVALVGSDGRHVAALQLGSTPVGLSFYDGSDGVLVISETAVYLWRPFSGRPPLVIPQPDTPIDAAVSESGQRLAVAGGGDTVTVWNASDGKLIRAFRPARGYLNLAAIPLRVAITADGNVVAAGSDVGTVSLWNVATGKLTTDTLSDFPIVELSWAADADRLLAVDWPEEATGRLPPGTGKVIDPATGKVLASYQSPDADEPIINPGAALSTDGAFLLSGATGLSPTPPGGFEAGYQLSTGQTMTAMPGALVSPVVSYSEFPVRPWSPDDDKVLVGNAIYSCDACVTVSALPAAATSRIAWSQPLSAASDHPPATNPYG